MWGTQQPEDMKKRGTKRQRPLPGAPPKTKTVVEFTHLQRGEEVRRDWNTFKFPQGFESWDEKADRQMRNVINRLKEHHEQTKRLRRAVQQGEFGSDVDLKEHVHINVAMIVYF
jgi:hypothetical protein